MQEVREARREGRKRAEVLEVGLQGSSETDVRGAVERAAGEGKVWRRLETVMERQGRQSRVRYRLDDRSLSIVSYDRPIRVTSRADQAANPLESVQCRPVHVVREAAHQHLEVLKKAGYETKFFTYQEGTLYRWGKAVITVSRLYLPESTKMADCKKNPVTDDWLVEVTMLTTSDAAEDAARTLLHIQNVLSERIALVK